MLWNIWGIICGIGIGGAIGFGMVYALLGLIYPVCSVIYFEKRKFLFVTEKEDEFPEGEAAEDAVDGEESEVPVSVKTGLHIKYIIAHAIVSVLVIALAAVLTPAEWSQYIGGDYYEDYYGDDFVYDYGLEKAEGSFQEEITDEEVISANFNDMALYLGYIDTDELLTEIEYIEAEDYDNKIDLHAMDLKDAYQFIFTEYFAVADYEEALFAINPYTEEVITSFDDYQAYVMMEVEKFYSLYEE